jgi:hypothetical protein
MSTEKNIVSTCPLLAIGMIGQHSYRHLIALAIRLNGMEHLFQFAFDIAAHSFHAGCKNGEG